MIELTSSEEKRENKHQIRRESETSMSKTEDLTFMVLESQEEEGKKKK